MNTIYRLPVIFSAVAIFYFCFMLWIGDLIPVNSGLGYDGANSAKFSQDVATHLIENPKGAYTFQKSLLWFVLGGVYWVIGLFSDTFADSLANNDIAALTLPVNPSIALVTWTIVNSLCIVITLLLWARLLDRFQVTGRTPVLIALFTAFPYDPERGKPATNGHGLGLLAAAIAGMVLSAGLVYFGLYK